MDKRNFNLNVNILRKLLVRLKDAPFHKMAYFSKNIIIVSGHIVINTTASIGRICIKAVFIHDVVII